MDYSDVSVVMITLNEEGAIAKVIGDAQAHLPGAEVIVIDGSSDATPEIAAGLGARVVREPPGGPAPALLAALRAPARPIVVTVDADDTYPAEVFPELVARVRAGDDVAGTDRLGRRPPKTMPIPNWFANVAFNVIASVRTRQRILDVHSGQPRLPAQPHRRIRLGHVHLGVPRRPAPVAGPGGVPGERDPHRVPRPHRHHDPGAVAGGQGHLQAPLSGILVPSGGAPSRLVLAHALGGDPSRRRSELSLAPHRAQHGSGRHDVVALVDTRHAAPHPDQG